MKISIRKFEEKDIIKKVEWINNPDNNEFLHYDLPLDVEKTKKWYKRNATKENRYDAIIEADGIGCGTIGLLNIDKKNMKAEFYIAMGETSFKGKGIATKASKLLLEYAFKEIGLNKVYLMTETGNLVAQKLFEKIGFLKEGCLLDDLYSRGKFVDRYVYGICKKNLIEDRQ